MLTTELLSGLNPAQCAYVAYAIALRVHTTVPDSPALSTDLDDVLEAVATHLAHTTPTTASNLDQVITHCLAEITTTQTRATDHSQYAQ